MVGVREEADRRPLARLLGPFAARIEWMSVESAEMTKHAINAFLATSVTFANEIASICEQVGADAEHVLEVALRRHLKVGHGIGPHVVRRPQPDDDHAIK